MIKTVFLCLVAYVVANAQKEYIPLPQEVVPKIGDSAFTCLSKNGLDQEALPKLLAGEIQDTPQIRKFIQCFATGSGYGDKNGHFKEDKMVKLVGNHKSKDKYRSVVQECNKSQGSNSEDTLFQTVICFVKKSPILFTL
ncbi:uncharacterized protein LOC121730311 [Aricia agestis]|uniref:uncharacterized protein LOC121730311 n=1 Tax=Aricia agestis TaxID=91739 RepID=UPI001C20BB9D|nr:uncharacterized protein LOC121730311 [Aricia agestis]